MNDTPKTTPTLPEERPHPFTPLRDVSKVSRPGGEEKVRQHMAAITRTMFAAYADFRAPEEWSASDDLYRDAMVSWLLSLVPPEHVPTPSRHLTVRPQK